jgi:hypothetical protein
MNRLVKHPVIRKDPDFRTFLQEGKLAATLNVRKGVARSFSDAFSGISQVEKEDNSMSSLIKYTYTRIYLKRLISFLLYERRNSSLCTEKS